MTPLTVALDVGPLHGHRTGVGVAVAHLLERLRARDDVEVLPYLVSARARPTPPERRLPIPAALAVRTWTATGRPRVDRWLDGASLVHGTNYTAPPSRLPTLVSVYDCWFLRHPDAASPAVRRAGRLLHRAVEAGAHVHASSEATAEHARRLLATDRVHVVHLGAVPPPQPGPAAPVAGLAGSTFVAAIGTLERRKAIPDLVAAYGRLVARGLDVRLVLAGAPGDDADGVRAAVDALDPTAAAGVSMLGAVDDATKGWLLANASALVYPSLDEGFGFPVLEAQLAGVPVVARRAGSIPEIGGDGVELVDGTPDGAFDERLADALERVLTDGALRLGLIADGTRNANRFDWTKTADDMVALYRRILTEGR